MFAPSFRADERHRTVIMQPTRLRTQPRFTAIHGIAPSEAAVSDVIANILMIGITIIMVGGIILTLPFLEGPSEVLHGDLGVQASASKLVIRHQGGEPLPIDRGTVVVTFGTGNTTTYPLSSWPASAWAPNTAPVNGAWEVGETLCVSCRWGNVTLTETTLVAFQSVQVDWRGRVVVGTGGVPNNAPTANAAGPYSVNEGQTVVLNGTASTDPDPGQSLTYQWTIVSGPGSLRNPGTATPTYVAPTDVAGNQTATVRLTVTDPHGATATATVNVTVRDVSGTAVTYVDSWNAVTGSVVDGSNAQADDNTLATLKEATVVRAFTNVYSANSVVETGGWTNPTNGFSSNDQYATASLSGGGSASVTPVRYALTDEANPVGTVTNVVVNAEVRASSTNSAWRIQPCLGTTCSPWISTTQSPTTDTVLSFPVTNQHPTGGSWTWSDVNNLEVRLEALKPSGGNVQFFIDHVFVGVTYQTPRTDMVIEARFSGVPSGASQELQLEYRVSDPANETFAVQVWDGSSWNTRGTALTASTLTQWTYTLTSQEFNGGTPQVRFVDLENPTDDRTTNLLLDYLRVVTTP